MFVLVIVGASGTAVMGPRETALWKQKGGCWAEDVCQGLRLLQGCDPEKVTYLSEASVSSSVNRNIRLSWSPPHWITPGLLRLRDGHRTL